MQDSLEQTLQTYPRPFITDGELHWLIGGSANSCYAKVKRMLAQGKLLHIRKGLYCLTEKLGYYKKPHPFALAHFIYNPSYVSLESALSYHRLIPEAVYTTTSACIKRSKEFVTPLGVFSFQTLPTLCFYTEVTLIRENDAQFMLAKPWKAICDYVYCYKKDWISVEPLFESLRIEPDNLPALHFAELEILDEYYQQKRISKFLKAVQRDLKL